jgi:DNA-binding transcriptional LysR family regulator
MPPAASTNHTNRSGEMEVFVRVVDRGGFSPAARELQMTPSAVSKLITRLEQRLGAALVHRSTRKLQITAEGQRFYERSTRVLADLDDAERGVASGGAPRGRVTINTSASFGTQVLIPLVPRLLAQHPGIALELAFTDRVVDLMDERADIAVRWGPLPASDLIARRLGHTGQVIVASPRYLASHGTPSHPRDLEGHEKLGFSYRRRVPDWPMKIGRGVVDIPVDSRVRAADGEMLRKLALAGAGLVRLSRFHVQADLDAGRLLPLLERFNPGDLAPIHAVYLGKPGRLPARVRALLDFLAAAVGPDGRPACPTIPAEP